MSENPLGVDMAAQRAASMSRRRFLRGVGACIAVPTMASLMSKGALADIAMGPAGRMAASASGMPIRMGFVYFPNGAIPSTWWPEGEGRDFILNRTMEPLVKVKDRVQVIGGLDL